MKLSDSEILAALDTGELQIDPRPDAERICGVTADLRLGGSFLRFRNLSSPVFVDLDEESSLARARLQAQITERQELEVGESLVLNPGELLLGATLETIRLPAHLVGWLDGRSRLARMGFLVHLTAHRVDPGWSGKIVLECHNAGPFPLRLRVGMPVAALAFEPIRGLVKRPYGSRPSASYWDQQNAVL